MALCLSWSRVCDPKERVPLRMKLRSSHFTGMTLDMQPLFLAIFFGFVAIVSPQSLIVLAIFWHLHYHLILLLIIHLLLHRLGHMRLPGTNTRLMVQPYCKASPMAIIQWMLWLLWYLLFLSSILARLTGARSWYYCSCGGGWCWPLLGMCIYSSRISVLLRRKRCACLIQGPCVNS